MFGDLNSTGHDPTTPTFTGITSMASFSALLVVAESSCVRFIDPNVGNEQDIGFGVSRLGNSTYSVAVTINYMQLF